MRRLLGVGQSARSAAAAFATVALLALATACSSNKPAEHPTAADDARSLGLLGETLSMNTAAAP